MWRPLGMLGQHCIAASLAREVAVATLKVVLADAGGASRTECARRVRREFGFLDTRGQSQVVSRQKALRSLLRAGRIALPAPHHHGRFRAYRPRRLVQPIPKPIAVPDEPGAVRALRLMLVMNSRYRQIWTNSSSASIPGRP